MNGGTLHLRGSDWKATLREVRIFPLPEAVGIDTLNRSTL